MFQEVPQILKPGEIDPGWRLIAAEMLPVLCGGKHSNSFSYHDQLFLSVFLRPAGKHCGVYRLGRGIYILSPIYTYPHMSRLFLLCVLSVILLKLSLSRPGPSYVTGT